MGTFAETAIVDDRFSFADHRKQTYIFLQQQTEVLLFPFPFATNKRKSPISVGSVFRSQKWPLKRTA
jgi:hypothetical protein